MFSLLDSFITYLDNHNSLGVIISVIGWIVVYALSNRSSNKQLKNSLQAEIYKEVNRLKLEIDERGIELSVLLLPFSLPFMEMEWCEKYPPLEGKNKNPYQIWHEYVNKVQKRKFDFGDSCLRLWNYLDIWRAEMKDISYAKDLLYTEFDDFDKKISKYIDYLNIDIPKGHLNWKEWDRKEAEKKAESLSNDFDINIAYLSDLIDLVHEELIFPILKSKRVKREDFNYRKKTISKTLTRTGIKNIEYQPTRIATLRKE